MNQIEKNGQSKEKGSSRSIPSETKANIFLLLIQNTKYCFLWNRYDLQFRPRVFHKPREKKEKTINTHTCSEAIIENQFGNPSIFLGCE